MKEKIKKFLPIIIWYIILLTSIITGPLAIKIIVGALFIITTFLVVIYFVKKNKNIEKKAQFNDWQIQKYGFIAESKKEIKKRKEEFNNEHE